MGRLFLDLSALSFVLCQLSVVLAVGQEALSTNYKEQSTKNKT